MFSAVSPSEQDVFLALWSFLTDILPSGDAVFTAGISGGNILTVTGVSEGAIQVGDAVLGGLTKAGTTVAGLGTGSGGVGTYLISPSQADAPPAVMSTGVAVLQAQVDKVPEPKAEDFITMTMLRQPRLGTNLDLSLDVLLTGSIAAGALTATAVPKGKVKRGARVFGVGVASGTQITAFLSGAGGVGTYSVAPSQNLSSRTLAAGSKSMMQPSQFDIQLDIHGPNSSNVASAIATSFRDEFGVDAFFALNPAISPLYCTDPRQMPFINAEQGYENRYVVEVHLQVNQVSLVSQQFFDAISVGLTSIDTPPSSWPNSTASAP